MWSKLVDYGVGVIAKDYYDLNRCQYHNWQHILDCYEYLEKSNAPYSEILDFAVMHHDIIYDQWPEKEARSAGFVISKYPDMKESANAIMATANHSIKNVDINSYWLIRADLHQLADKTLSIRNYYKIMHESITLYNIDVETFATNNLFFMKSLKKTVIENYSINADKFWLDVLTGIELTMDISSAIVKNS